ncbi:MAG TPA: hypothetical protein PK289_03575 [Bacteroidia bacterium]|nr:hypothetical protein [Bacteroidia bacterium]HRG51690.1 hypothetical protein [Bacteroidia bacterium]
MKTPGKNQKKQDSGATHGSKANAHKTKITTGKDAGKGPWKNPDPTDPRKSPEKVNEPFAGKSTFPGEATSKKPATGFKGEKVTNAGESEHHIPVNKSDYDSYEEEYDEFEFEDDDDEFEEDDDEKGETSANYYEDEEDESKQFRSQVNPAAQKKANEQAKFTQKQNNFNAKQQNKTLENKNKSQLNANFNQKKNNNPQA